MYMYKTIPVSIIACKHYARNVHVHVQVHAIHVCTLYISTCDCICHMAFQQSKVHIHVTGVIKLNFLATIS